MTRVRVAATAFFAVDGFIFASWAVRIPAVKAATHASPAALGLALLGVSCGAIATMAISGEAVPPVRQQPGDRRVRRAAVVRAAAPPARPVGAVARPGARGVRHRVRSHERLDEQPRRRPGGRAGPPDHAVVPRGVELRGARRGERGRPARAAPDAAAAPGAGGAGGPGRDGGRRADAAGAPGSPGPGAAAPGRGDRGRRANRRGGAGRGRGSTPRARPCLAGRAAVRADRPLLRLRRGRDRRLGGAAPAGGSRRGCGAGRRGLCRVRAGRGLRAAGRKLAARQPRADPGPRARRPDRVRWACSPRR